MEELLRYMVRALVDHPDEVTIDAFEEDDGTVVLEVGVAEDDVGQVVGRGGRTINALRAVMRASSVKEGRRVLVDVVE
ncbi:MAG TPA: KH domain-containing protein [Thermoleophilaceae bacterium]|nr:KH domain-containing protein [Thermoleophilaceae bacterium]